MEVLSERATAWSVFAVWAAALAGSIVVLVVQWSDAGGFAAPSHPIGAFGALGVVLGITVVLALVVQVATRRPPGFVARVTVAIGGAVAIVVVAAAVATPSVLAA